MFTMSHHNGKAFLAIVLIGSAGLSRSVPGTTVPAGAISAGDHTAAGEEIEARFFETIQKGDLPGLSTMLESHPELANARQENGRSAVMVALTRVSNQGFTDPGQNEILKAILAKSPSLTFHEACGVGRRTAEVARALEADPKLATSWDHFGWSALHLAAFSGDAETAKLLIDHGADIQARAKSRFRNTPLQVALLTGQYDMTKLLLEEGADVLVRQTKGFAPIHEAAFLGRQDLVDLLLDHGAEVDARTNDGRTADTEALRRKHPEIAKYLESKGSNRAAKDLMAKPD